MRNLTLLVIIVFTGLYSNSQDYFKLGTKFFNEGNYQLADSFYTIYLTKQPIDINGIYNRGVSRLYLHDTCTFCMDLYKINEIVEIDKKAQELYYQYCGRADTIYYNKYFELSTKSEYRYFEVIQHHRYLQKITGKIYDKKRKIEVSPVSLSQIITYRTNVFASYTIDENGEKLYAITDCPPSLPKGSTISEDVKYSDYYQDIKKSLSLTDVSVFVSFVINNNGEIKNIKIEKTRPKIEITDNLLKGLQTLYSQLPKYTPGKLKGRNINYSMMDIIKF